MTSPPFEESYAPSPTIDGCRASGFGEQHLETGLLHHQLGSIARPLAAVITAAPFAALVE